MFTSQGMAVGAWVTVDGHCQVSCDIVGDQVQFEFGHRAGALHLAITKQGLADLVEVATAAHSRLNST